MIADATEMAEVSQEQSPTGYWAPVGKCGTRGCPSRALYEARFSDWPSGFRTGACAACAVDLRKNPRLLSLRTWVSVPALLPGSAR